MTLFAYGATFIIAQFFICLWIMQSAAQPHKRASLILSRPLLHTVLFLFLASYFSVLIFFKEWQLLFLSCALHPLLSWLMVQVYAVFQHRKHSLGEK